MDSSSDEGLKRMYRLVNMFLTRNDCEPFREAVQWQAFGLFDYPKIIKRPMDLGAIRRKLELKRYKNISECADDFRLVWNNCKTYNVEGSDFYILADTLSKKFEDRYKKLCSELGVADDPNNNKGGSSNANRTAESVKITLDDKTRFASALFRLSGMELGHVMQVLDLRCPQVFEELDPTHNGENGTRIEINVDKIDTKTFVELDTYVKQKLLEKTNDDGPDTADTQLMDKKPKHKPGRKAGI